MARPPPPARDGSREGAAQREAERSGAPQRPLTHRSGPVAEILAGADAEVPTGRAPDRQRGRGEQDPVPPPPPRGPSTRRRGSRSGDARWSPSVGSNRHRRDSCSKAEADVHIDGQPYYERTIWLVTANCGHIEEVTLYCSGEWDTEARARQKREAPMLRPWDVLIANVTSGAIDRWIRVSGRARRATGWPQTPRTYRRGASPRGAGRGHTVTAHPRAPGNDEAQAPGIDASTPLTMRLIL